MDGQRHQALTGVRQLLAFETSPELRTHHTPIIRQPLEEYSP
jgi:hypothetical protein